ncbi:MAG: hypothetical protein OSB62_02765 [Alphaproteobacteria bacterium]|nr:hypothetical protein [Alphaproteobacteria bacterium]
MKKLWFYSTTFVLIVCAYLHFNYAEPMAILAFFGTWLIMLFEGKNLGLRLFIFAIAWWFFAMDYALVQQTRQASETMYGFSLGWLSLLVLIERWKTYIPLRQERL